MFLSECDERLLSKLVTEVLLVFSSECDDVY